MDEQWGPQKKDRRALLGVLYKVTVYYVVLIALVALCIRFIPGFLDGLPIGGVSDLSGAADLEISQLEDALLNGDFEEDDFAAVEPRSGSAFRIDDALSLFMDDAIRLADSDARFLGFVKNVYFVAFWQHTQLKPVLADAEATLLAVQREIEGRS